jgi:uncharacterized protein (TIRG00374 family)
VRTTKTQELFVNTRTLLNLGKYILAFSLLGWVIWKNWAPTDGRGLSYVWNRHMVEGRPIHWPFLLGAFLLLGAAICLQFVRWYVLVRAQDLPFRLRDAFRLGLIGFFYSSFLPGSVGGDIVKAAAIARGQSRRTVAVATVLMDRGIALWGLFWFVALAGAVFWLTGALEGRGQEKAQAIVVGASLVVAISAGVWLLLGLLPERRAQRFAGRLTKIPKIGHSAAEFWRAVWMYRCRQRSVALALLLSWVAFVGLVGCFYCSARALWDGDPHHAIPTLAQHFLLVPVGMVIQSVPFFPGGAGIGELGYAFLYGLFGCDGANGVLGSLVQRVVTWVLSLLGYLIALSMTPARVIKRETATSEENAVVGPGRTLCPETTAVS